MKNDRKKQPEPQGTLFVTPLEDVLPASMLPYAEFVILDRALPRVEDGLKPVQRRILYTMYEMGLTPDKPHKKSARIVGDCMGKYHPHGDFSVYDAMVRMAQDFNMGRTLVNGHGNFGSVDGDPAAAMRYTEARLEPLALELLRDLDKNTVPFSLNFDDSLKEPDMLPGRFPNLLVNGASGIAVGLATNIPPHNLAETIDGVVAYIDNPKITLEEMRRYIPAPDFPTGGYIIANELEQAYRTGKGRITLRARIHVEQNDNGKKTIVITELPYQVNKSALLRKIADLREEKKEELAAITRVQDESDREGIRAIVEVRADGDVDKVLKLLYKYTDLETTFGINMVAIAGGKPMLMGLMDIIRYYVGYQREVVLARTKFDLAAAKERCHILEGLIIAVRNIDEVVKIIKNADSTSDARDKLRKRFSLSEKQAQAILDLRLARLTKLEVFKLEEELKRLKELIEYLTAIVNSQRRQLEVVKEEILQIKKAYKTPRRSELVDSVEQAGAEREDVRAPGVKSVLCITADGRLKCVSERGYAMTAGKTLTADTANGLIVSGMTRMLSGEDAIIVSDLGNCYRIRGEQVSCKLTDKGYSLYDLFDDAAEDERPVAILPSKAGEGYLLVMTKQSMIKKTLWSEYDVNKTIFQAIRLNEGDRVISVQPADPDEEGTTIFMVTRGGMCINAKNEIPVQKRIAGGVRGINLRDGDEVIFASQIHEEGEIVTVTADGRFKRVIAAQIDPLPRYRKGVQITSLKGTELIFADYVTEPYTLAVRTDEDEVLEIDTEDIPIDTTSTRGRPFKGTKWKPVEIHGVRFREK